MKLTPEAARRRTPPLTSLLSSALVLLGSAATFAQASTDSFAIYDTGAGRTVSLPGLVGSLAEADVVFFGETHDDPLAHHLEDSIYAALLARYGQVALSLEMFEADVQPVVDEYLAGLIDRDRLEGDGRAWPNYEAYHPLVERARAAGQDVVAANAPGRHTRLVGRRGPGALDELPRESREVLPRRPYRYVDTAYRRRFGELMGGVSGHAGAATSGTDVEDLSPFFAAQMLWDATMAERIYERWRRGRRDDAKVFHVTGSFHVDYRQGTVSQLRALSRWPTARTIVVVPPGESTPDDLDALAERADFVVVRAR